MKLKFLSMVAAAMLVTACGDEEATQAVTSSSGGGDSTQSSEVMQTLQENLSTTAGDRVFFDVDRWELTSEARVTLEKQAQWLMEHPGLRLVIAGNCDERGTRQYNLALGERRATAAKNYLVSLGINKDRLSTVSYGKERPAVPGTSEAVWAQNRNAISYVQE